MDQLQQFIDLVDKTGDNLVVFDRHNPEKSFVILAIKEYNKLLNHEVTLGGLTEAELADKINRDIAIWKNEQILADANYNDFDWSEEVLETDEQLEEEELNYLYPEAETLSPAIPFVEDEPLTEIDNLENDLQTKTEEQAGLADFESLSDLLDARFDKNRVNNWSIPKDRQQQAEELDNATKYQTISY